MAQVEEIKELVLSLIFCDKNSSAHYGVNISGTNIDSIFESIRTETNNCPFYKFYTEVEYVSGPKSVYDEYLIWTGAGWI